MIEPVRTSTVPVATLLGVAVEEIGGGRAVAWLQTRPQHANPMGTVHGGILCHLADTAMGIAFVTTLSLDESFTTMALIINLLHAGLAHQLHAEARVVNRGTTIGYVECDVSNHDGKLVAKARSACVV